jgi:hypothetical protein
MAGSVCIRKILAVMDEVLVVLLLHEMHLSVAYTDAVKWEFFVVMTCGVIGGQTFIMEEWGLQEAMMAVYAAVCVRKLPSQSVVVGIASYSLGIIGVVRGYKNIFVY